MKNFYQHCKEVAIADVHRFFEPFVAVGQAARNLARRATIRGKSGTPTGE